MVTSNAMAVRSGLLNAENMRTYDSASPCRESDVAALETGAISHRYMQSGPSHRAVPFLSTDSDFPDAALQDSVRLRANV